MSAQGQTFTKHNFKVQTPCTLTNVLNTKSANNDDVAVYQCMEQTQNSVTIYRISVITFQEQVLDEDFYIQEVNRDYREMGQSSKIILFKNKKSVTFIEDVNIEGNELKQITLSFLHKNKAISLVVVSNNSNISDLMTKFQNQFYFL